MIHTDFNELSLSCEWITRPVMARTYLQTMFGPVTEALQTLSGSRASYARMTEGAGECDPLTDRELGFIAARDSFYIASVTGDGWPYVQHRGGPPGFLRWLGGQRLAFGDFPGNRQYISTANLINDARVSLFLMDYPNRRRLKLVGRCNLVEEEADTHPSSDPDRQRMRTFVVDVVGFDWNCPKYITPRFTRAEVAHQIQPMLSELAALRTEVAKLKEMLK